MSVSAPIVVVDYGMGNLGSIVNMLRKVGADAEIGGSPEIIRRASKLILPGVGAFDTGMRAIAARGLREALDAKALDERVPVLGICLGAQLLTRSSEEGVLPGLGWIPAHTTRFVFPSGSNYKVPHMGWNDAVASRPSPLTDQLPAESRYYFVHSFYIRTDDEADSLLKTSYGVEFDSGIHRGNIYGVQFHPEKSHKFGMNLLRSFSKL
jgi:glutamine amidotransferase